MSERFAGAPAEPATVKNPLVGIVLPTLNGTRCLAAASDSSLRQTCAHWELFVVESGQ
jgi:glycosyltransferase involved in cell wall biosynthesis